MKHQSKKQNTKKCTKCKTPRGTYTILNRHGAIGKTCDKCKLKIQARNKERTVEIIEEKGTFSYNYLLFCALCAKNKLIKEFIKGEK